MHREIGFCEITHTGHLNIPTTFLAIWFDRWQWGSNVSTLFVPGILRLVQLFMDIWNRPQIFLLLIAEVLERLLDGRGSKQIRAATSGSGMALVTRQLLVCRVVIYMNTGWPTEWTGKFSLFRSVTRCNLAFDRPREKNLGFYKRIWRQLDRAVRMKESRKHTTSVRAEEIEHPKPAIMIRKSREGILGTLSYSRGRGINYLSIACSR